MIETLQVFLAYTLLLMALIFTCYNGRNPPAHYVVESHVSKIDVPHFSQHAVDVKLFDKHPSKGAHVEVVQKNSNNSAHKLGKEKDPSQSELSLINLA